MPCRRQTLRVSVYQYPSENQNGLEGISADTAYQFINIHQRTKTTSKQLLQGTEYQFINIHQRTKTKIECDITGRAYQFINIHQRTKTLKRL